MERSLRCWSSISCSNRICQHTGLCKMCCLEEQEEWHRQRGNFCVESSRQPGLLGPKCIWLEGSCSWGKPFLMRRLIPVEESELSSQLSSWETSPSWLHLYVQWQAWFGGPLPSSSSRGGLERAGRRPKMEGFASCEQARWAAPLQWALNLTPTLKAGARACKSLPTNGHWDRWSAATCSALAPRRRHVGAGPACILQQLFSQPSGMGWTLKLAGH